MYESGIGFDNFRQKIPGQKSVFYCGIQIPIDNQKHNSESRNFSLLGMENGEGILCIALERLLKG